MTAKMSMKYLKKIRGNGDCARKQTGEDLSYLRYKGQIKIYISKQTDKREK